MKFSEFKYKDVLITNSSKQNDILKSNKFYWMIDAEIESAKIEIKNDTIIWESGDWYYGDWYYGIWKSGDFYDGVFHNGIWESGNFHNGKFISGIWESGNILGGDVNIKK